MMDRNELPFCNKTIDRAAMKRLIGKLVVCFGIASTTNILDQVKVLGFQQATEASISLGIDDLSAVPTRGWLVRDAEKQGYVSEGHYRCGSLHAIEKLRQSIEAWYATSECLKREMSPSFKMIDPLNPVHMMSVSGARGTISQVHQLLGMRGLMADPRGQVIDLPIRRNLREGLSLTEYIISCYGARKGVVDTAVRTSDAGYLTRRLVEVVQHIAVRRRDCETPRSLAFLTSNTGERRRGFLGTMPHQGLVGRVLADHVYWDVRCIATRNQDISDGLASNLMASSQPIHVRSPLTCKSIFWICQFCYGWSLAHCNLVELGEAVGIIAGQSIGEPGTQLTLRTFHTGGVFTGDIAEYVRIPFNGLIKFDERLLHPTRTRHGHPAWMCRNDLPLFIGNSVGTQNSLIPAQSLLMIRTGQYVESQQVIAEVRAKEFPPKECIRKPIYPNSRGEIHWSKFVWHVRDSICNIARLVREASHIWILSGSPSKFDGNSFFHKDQDRVRIKPHPIKRIRSHSEGIFEAQASASNCVDRRKGIQEFGTDSKYFSNWSKRPRSNYILSNVWLERAELENSVSLLMERCQKNIKKLDFVSINVQLNNGSDQDHIFATYENFEYQTIVSGIIKYGTVEIKPVNPKRLQLDGGTGNKSSRPWCRVVRKGNFFLIPEEVYLTHEPSSSILVTNNAIVKKGAQITNNIITKSGGLIRMRKRSRDATTIRILPGYIYNPEKQINISKRGNTLLAPGNRISDDIEVKNWIYLQPFTFRRKGKTFVLMTPVSEYNLSSDSLAQVASRFDKPKTQRRAKAKTLSFICCKNGEKIEVINDVPTQLVRLCLIIEWQKYLHETLPRKRNYFSLISVKISYLFKTFLQVNPMVSPPTQRGVRVDEIFRTSTPLGKPSPPQLDLANSCCKSAVNCQGIIHLTLEPATSFLILSPFNLSRNNSVTDTRDGGCGGEIGKYFYGSEDGFFCIGENKKKISLSSKCISENYANPNVEEGWIKARRASSNLGQRKAEEVGLVGTLSPISCSSIPHHLSLGGKNLSTRKGFVDYSIDKSEHQDFYLIDESKLLLKCPINFYVKKGFLDKPSYLPTRVFSREIMLISLGLLISESRYLHRDRTCFQSGQVMAIHQDYSLVRTGKTFLATRGANPHKSSGDILEEGDTLITLPYDRLKSGDITQGLPKVEQLLESRSIASISAGIGDLFEKWCQNITKLIGNPWSHLLGAGRSMEHCQLILIDQIRKVYESQGVRICDKHLEIIVRQLTSRVVASEDGVTNVFLPGELVELSQAERINRVLKKSIFYEPIVLGMTRASLSTTSFLAEASFQETTRVLAKAALRGRIDWLKGLKENVVIGDSVPVGTGSPEIYCQLNINKEKESRLASGGSKKLTKWETGSSLSGYHKKRDFNPSFFIRKELNRSFTRLHLDMW
uniref:DNA-directed RNA polymerase subunit beta'' n=1 Tax=Adiantum capillus-veneris TaxID=13818 RepID=RPOC2_ADICA|nr:RecName: Full=DNA-directed RNA polymerase subunit beta''; AltName: Full=PEP; AltName: Full=Plastid-encoded RNA polymerase subunit beta''; Short=RNA polymerase subunit beta'' [Adiantum capillus-veneris]AAP29382.2 RNA polymerase beta'' chain [Adiantum capillus-veneris]